MSLSPYFDRQSFERHLIGRAPINTEPVPIPRDAIPSRLKSHEINLNDDELFGRSAMGELASKVLAEDRRLRNLLPPPPYGYEWHGDLQTAEDFASLRISARIVYTLREIE